VAPAILVDTELGLEDPAAQRTQRKSAQKSVFRMTELHAQRISLPPHRDKHILVCPQIET